MPEEKVSQQECKCPTGAKYHVYGCALDGELLAAADAGPRQPDTCKDCGQSIHFEPDGHFVHDERIDHCLAHDRGQWPEPAAPPVPQEAAPRPLVSVNEPRFNCSECGSSVAESYRSQHVCESAPDICVCGTERNPIGYCKVCDKFYPPVTPATAPDWAMRQDEPLKALRQWEADTEAPANASEGNAFIDGFNAGREAGSERERLASATASQFIEGKLIAPFLHGDQEHQDWLREETRKWIPELAALMSGRELKLREALRIAAIFAPHNHPFVGDITPGCPKCEASRLLGGESK